MICQLPPEAGCLAHIGARLTIPAYGLNNAPRRWWNRLDTSLRNNLVMPTRADRCCYIYHSKQMIKTSDRESSQVQFDIPEQVEKDIESLTDQNSGSPSRSKRVSGIICLHVDDAFSVGDNEFLPTCCSFHSKMIIKLDQKASMMSYA